MFQNNRDNEKITKKLLSSSESVKVVLWVGRSVVGRICGKGVFLVWSGAMTEMCSFAVMQFM